MGLRQIIGEFGDWMANGRPPWAAYRALLLGRLIGLNNFPGVRQAVMEETWCRMLAKCVLTVTAAEAKEACGTEQLCGGLDAVIEVGIHAMQILWQNHFQREEWGFLLIAARNAFNEDNHTAMLWAVHHECPSGARFEFNCYRHWATLVIRAGGGTGNFLFRKEGVNQ